MNEFKRVEEFEKAFKKRYGKDVKVYAGVLQEDKKLFNKVTVQIKHGDDTYKMEEFLNSDRLTDYVLVHVRDNVYRYRTYLEAEIYVADLIGEKIEKESHGNIDKG